MGPSMNYWSVHACKTNNDEGCIKTCKGEEGGVSDKDVPE